MKVSVLIGSRNRPHVLSHCLESITRQDYTQLEVIVLDDASYDVTSYSALVESYTGIRLIRSDSPCGVAAGRNRLISEASGDILCFIDDDAYFEDSTAISQFVSAFETDLSIGVVACKIIDHRDGKTDLLVPFSHRVRRKYPHITQQAAYVSYYLGTCHAIRRKVIEQCGMYFDRLVFGEEELDFSYRVLDAGYRIYYQPNIIVHHVPQPSVVTQGPRAQGSRDELYFHIRNRFYLAYRYLPAWYIPSYLFAWIGKYVLDAVKLGDVVLLVKGIVDGVMSLKDIKRERISPESLHYMRKNHGRVWY